MRGFVPVSLLGLVCVSTVLVSLVRAQDVPTLADYFTTLPSVVIDAQYSPRFVSAFPGTVDLNGDGHEDLLVLGADYPRPGVTTWARQPGRVFFGDRDGNFSAAPPGVFPIDTLQTVHPRKVLYSDFNGDERLDIFIADHGWDVSPFPGEQNRLYLSVAGGAWTDATDALPQLSDFTHSAAAGDLAGRGRPDIVVGNSGINVQPYALLNRGNGQFDMTRDVLPLRAGETMHISGANRFSGTTLADLNGDRLPELIVLVDGRTAANATRGSVILWNRDGVFSHADRTELPRSTVFPVRDDYDAQPIDVNGDSLVDLVLIGTQGNPLGDGWFVQLLLNQGNRTFLDVTAQRIAQGDTFAGTPGVATQTPMVMWVQVLDFNGDGATDFAFEYQPGPRGLHQTDPVIFLNDGAGYFTTLKVRDFVPPGSEWVLGTTHLMRTGHGYSFITPHYYAGSGGLRRRGLLATRPYRERPAPRGPRTRLAPGERIRAGQYELVYQADGNLVVSNTVNGAPIWSTVTGGTQPGALTMQGDGNLVLTAADSSVLWASNTQGHPGAYFQLQDDGNLVVLDAAGRVLWDRFR